MNCSNILGASGALPLRLSRSAPPRISMYLAIAVLLCLLSGRRSAGDRTRHLSGGDVEAGPGGETGGGGHEDPRGPFALVRGGFLADLDPAPPAPGGEAGGGAGGRARGGVFVRGGGGPA